MQLFSRDVSLFGRVCGVSSVEILVDGQLA